HRPKPALLRSVISIEPGQWVMQIGGRAACTAAWGVTPQAQKTGISPGRISGGSPQSGRSKQVIPMAAGSPRWTGAPWAAGNRDVISIARIASGGVSGRIDTTMPPPNGPAGTV